MGLFDKIKNVFFEEEYVEVEEPVKKKKEKEVIAKKIELPAIKKKKEKEVIEDTIEILPEEQEQEDVVVSDKDFVSKQNDNFRFPMNFEEEDFKTDDYNEVRVEPKREVKREIKIEEKIEYKEPVEKTYNNNHHTGLYEGSIDIRRKKEFTPTPIISPIYGILDKNYTKDEIVTKKEVRISSRPKHLDLDTVREKAYGDLASDITASMYEDIDTEEKKGDDNELYDLNEDTSPVVKNVTMGDAEEYYNDLGLEYNIDYKDTSKEKAIGRRIKTEEKKVKEKSKKEEKEEDAVVEDNLFDLIDSMYEDKE